MINAIPLMRYYRISFVFLLCLYISSLVGQVNIMGKVNHPTDTIITLMIPPTTLGGKPSNVSYRLSSGNKFRFAINTDIATPAVISHGGVHIPIFLVPDQSFSMEFTPGDQKVKEILFTGVGETENNFLNRYLQFLEKEAPPITAGQLAQSTARQYRKLMDQNRARRASFLELHSQQVAPQLLQWLRNDIAYTYATDLLEYPSVFRKLHNGTKSRNPSTRYYSFLEDISLNNPNAILQDSYQRFLESFITYKLKEKTGWELRAGAEYQYSLLDRFLFGPPLHYMQHLTFERTLSWLANPNYMANEYQSFMASEAPELLKQKLRKLRENPPKIHSIKSFSITGGPVLWEAFQFQDGSRPDSSFFNGQPTLLYFHDWHLTRIDFAIRYLKKLRRDLVNYPEINICLVTVNSNYKEWQRAYQENGYAKQPITHLSMNYFDELFDWKIEQGQHPKIVIADEHSIILETLDWKPTVKRVVEIIHSHW